MSKQYENIREAIAMIEDYSTGQRKVVEFKQCNKYWEFTLDNGIRVKLIGI